MRAILQPARWHRKVFLDLDDSSGLKSPVESVSGFDSKVEENFFHQWNAAPRMGWRLERESEILHHGQKTFVPDFVFVHEDGRRVLFEVIGFWTPEYLQQKWETLQLFQDKRILLAVAKSIHAKLPIHTTSVVLYKTEISVDEVVKQLVVS